MNKKKIVSVLAVIVIFLSFPFINTTYAVADETQNVKFATVNQKVYAIGKVNVRKSPSSSGEKIGMLKKDESVTRIGISNNGWSKVKYNGEIAYVSTDYLSEKTVEEINKEDSTKKTETTTNDEENTTNTEKSSISALKSLEIEEGKIVPDFNKNVTAYQIEIGADIDELKIDAIPESEKAVVNIEGNSNLKEGENVIEIIVNAEDGTKTTYSVFAIKSDPNPLGLKSLEIEGVQINPIFKADVYEYTTNVKNAESLDIHAIANKEGAKIEIVGNENLHEGENAIKIIVSKDDNMLTYTIKVNNEIKPQFNLSKEYIIGGGLGLVVVLLLSLLAGASRKSKRRGRH